MLSPVPLMQVATGFWASKTLAVAHELDLFSRLSGSSGVTPADVAEDLEIDQRPAELLLTGCAALGLLEGNHGRYVNSALAEEYLVRGTPYYFGGFVQMLDQRLYEGWGRLVEAVRTNRPTTWDPERQGSLFDGEDPQLLAGFWEAMHSLSTFTARVLADVVDLSGSHKLLDLGGGSAAFDIELCKRYPDLTATVYELSPITEIATSKISRAGLSQRIETVVGDFFSDPALPSGHDVVLLSMIMHDWNEQHDRDILRKCWEGLRSGGKVIIAELLVDDDKTGPPAAALMSMNMLIETEGRNYTSAEYTGWLHDAGFRDIHTIRFEAPGANGAVIGSKP
ncbi:methyltransferase [Microlunatus elymi]|uniref:Methyltransferase n=1 Tax=Microlunatus elymi TaxID=2596828 RepID=A0A516Q560_9ACTN|nr:methyltransferase [Microlunatus elymi]